MSIKPLKYNEIETLKSLQPKDWGDIRFVFKSHFNQPYFHAFTYKEENEIIGVGEAIILKDTAWIGNIIVHEAHRFKGIGKKITQFLLDGLQKRALKSIFLLATEMGKPLYEKLDFELIDNYQFLQTPKNLIAKPISDNIRQATPVDYETILQLDFVVMGEDRSSVLKNHLNEAFVFTKNSEIKGFHMPTLGNGLIIANSYNAGLELFNLRSKSGINFTCIPSANSKFLNHLLKEDYTPFRKAYLMKIGESKIWKPNLVFTRIAGNLG